MKEPPDTILQQKENMPKDKEVAEKKDNSHKEIEKVTNIFNLEDEVAKLKISIPLGE